MKQLSTLSLAALALFGQAASAQDAPPETLGTDA